MNLAKRNDRYEKWEELVSQQENSGKTQKAFCEENNIVLSQFTYYRAVISTQNKNNSCGNMSTLKKSPLKNPALFSPVTIKQETSTLLSEKTDKTEKTEKTEIKITLPNGFHCVISNSLDILHLKRLMEVLLSC